MRILRKKKIIDGMDREILRTLIARPIPPTSNQIARQVNLSSPAIFPRLRNLQLQGIIKQMNCGAMRKKINAPSKICWGIDIKKEIDKEKKKFFRS